MEIRVRVKCGECENGIVAGYAWDRFMGEEGREARERAEALRSAGEHSAAIDLEFEWFAERGALVQGRYGPQFPNEEEACVECEGTGYVERWASLDEVRAA